MGDSTHIETLNELKIWLEGEFKLIRQTQSNNAEEIRTLRKTVHDTNNAVGVLTALDIPGKLTAIKDEISSHDAAIEKLATDQTAIKSTMRAAYLGIGMAGAVVGAVVTILLRVYEIVGQ
jgi:hypothetical protein